MPKGHGVMTAPTCPGEKPKCCCSRNGRDRIKVIDAMKAVSPPIVDSASVGWASRSTGSMGIFDSSSRRTNTMAIATPAATTDAAIAGEDPCTAPSKPPMMSPKVNAHSSAASTS